MRKILQITGALLLGMMVLTAHAEPADDFLKAYFLLQDGDTAERGGESAKAIEKYSAALKILRTIKRRSPDWNPNIIAYRTKYCMDHIAKAGGKVEPEDTSAEPEPGPTPAPTPAPPVDNGQPVRTVPEGVTPAPTPDLERPAPVGAPSDRVSALERELEQSRTDLKKLQTEKSDLETRLRKAEEDLRTVALPTDERVKALMKDNDTLKQKLSDAERKVLSAPTSSDSVASLKQELTKAQAALDNLKKENERLTAANEALKKDLDDTRTQLKTALSSAASTTTPAELQTLQKENALLRSIVDRQFQEDAKRTSARDTLATELKELGTRTEAIKAQVDILSSPLTPLTDAEKDLLKTPAATLRESSDPKTLVGSVSANKGPGTATPAGDTAPKLTGDNAVLAADAKRLYATGDFNGAATKYEQIIQAEPNNLFALSNLGVIRFRQDKLDEAAKHLSAALAIDSQDAFSLSVLGVVYYRQQKYDEASIKLQTALVLAPNNHETHNYLGITYSAKGFQDAAEKELLKALELKPDYGDAHFNLAVVYASQNPPSVELARKHYKRALDLGVAKDAELEKLLIK